MRRKQLDFREARPDFNEYLQYIQTHRHPLSLLLDGVADVKNIGSLFRLADAARLEKIYCYRMESVQLTGEFKRVARSAEQFVEYEFLPYYNAVELLLQTHQLLALEWTNDSIEYHQVNVKPPILLAIGNEERGISDEMLQAAETCIHLPMYGVKTSMNVAMATGIAVYSILEKWNSGVLE
jgi:tRNA G18 (ribose-2'-O)-methylase SpoU